MLTPHRMAMSVGLFRRMIQPNNLLVLDARSPSEFILDAMPGAINTPVLSDEERIHVGTLFKKDQIRAKGEGAPMVLTRIAKMLEQYEWLRTPSPEKELLVYCARGGLRSGALASVLIGLGHRVTVLEGGYQLGYRPFIRHVTSGHELSSELEFVAISGLTGTGKTFYLHQLRKEGHQIVDLEALARHRGSLFGGFGEIHPPPTQKQFESHLVTRLLELNPALGPVYVEAESQKVGRVAIPLPLMHRMILSPRGGVIHLDCSMEQRIDNILAQYEDWIHHTNTAAIYATLDELKRASGDGKMTNALRECADRKDWRLFVRILLEKWYDGRYSKSIVTRTLQMCEKRVVRKDGVLMV